METLPRAPNRATREAPVHVQPAEGGVGGLPAPSPQKEHTYLITRSSSNCYD